MPSLLDGIAFVDGEKYVNGETKNVFYVGSKQEDGYIYFNDSDFFRCDYEGHNLQIFYIPKQIWVSTSNLVLKRINGVDVVQLRDDVNNVQNGSGAIAANASVEAAVKWAIDKATNNYVTYADIAYNFDGSINWTETARRRHLKDVNATQYDCSSFIITAFYAAGFNINANATGDMRSGFTAAGFLWIPGNYFTAFNCRRGDILLDEVNHTQMYIGNNQDVNCGSTPARVCDHSVDNYSRGWDGILRYGG